MGMDKITLSCEFETSVGLFRIKCNERVICNTNISSKLLNIHFTGFRRNEYDKVRESHVGIFYLDFRAQLGYERFTFLLHNL